MSQGFATFLLMNNYFHDVATAMPAACSLLLWVVLKHLGERPEPALAGFASSLVRGLTWMFRFSILWIVASGSVRIATFRSFEWFNTTQKHFEAGLLVKYAIAGVMMVGGTIVWLRLSRIARQRLDHP